MHPNPKIVSANPPGQRVLDPDFRLSMRALLSHAPNLLKRLNVDAGWLVDPTNQAGQGQFAVVWWLPDETRVLKVTFDPTDAAACAAVATVSPLDGVVSVDDVVQLGDTGRFAIVAENAEPYGDSKFVKSANRARFLLSSVIDDDLDTVDESIRQRGPSDDSLAEEFFRKLLAGWKWLFENGFYVTDLHGHNVGWSSLRQQPVIIDLGSHQEDLSAYSGGDGAPVSRPTIPLARNKGSAMPQVSAAFAKYFDKVERIFPDFGTIELHEDEAAGSDNGHGSERQFGYCAEANGSDPITITFAEKTEALPSRYIDGLMAHEFGHALEYRYGVPALEKRWGKLPTSIERRADKIAEHAFGHRIEYGENDVQCIGCGGKPTRPRRLG